MSFDLSWLWDIINTISQTVQSWFSSIWSSVQNIINTGQGIFAGLIAFGSQLWDAFIKGLSTLGEWLYKQFEWVYNGVKYWADVFGQWFSIAISWVGSGVSWIAQQFYNFGNWIWNGILWIWDTVRNAIIGLWNWITTTISGIISAIGTWWCNVTNGINTWFTNLLKTFRQKLTATITADVAIYSMWKAGERILQPTSLKDIGYGLLGIGLSPIIGYAIGKFVDALVPIPSTEPYPLIPNISGLTYTPPSLEVERPIEPTAPDIGAPPAMPIQTQTGLPYDKYIEVKLTKETTLSSKDKTAGTIEATYEIEVST